MRFDWKTDSEWEFFANLAAWFIWSLAQVGIGWLEAGLGNLPVSGTEAVALAVVVAVGFLWMILRLIKMLAFLSSLAAIGLLAVRVVAL